MKQYLSKVFAEFFNNEETNPEFPYSVDPAQLAESTQHLLSAYVEAKLDDRDAAALFPNVHKAIATFPAFADEFESLYDLLDAERKGELEEPPYIPTFDFSYLNLPMPVDPRSSVVEAAGKFVIQLSEELLQSLQTNAFAANRLQPASAQTLRNADTWQTWLTYSPPNPPPDLQVDISFKHLAEENECCNVVVQVDVPSRGGWPNLADSQVHLCGEDAADQLGITDAFGRTVFKNIKKRFVPQLSFEIMPVHD